MVIERRLEIARKQALRWKSDPDWDVELAARSAVYSETKGIEYVGKEATFAAALTDPPLMHGRGVPSHFARTGVESSAVYACINTVATAVCEPPLRVYRRIPKADAIEEYERLGRHPIDRLLDRPNRRRRGSNIVGLTLKQMTWLNQWYKHVDGNAYWLKSREGDPITGTVTAITPVGPHQMIPWTEEGSANLIDYYLYAPHGLPIRDTGARADPNRDRMYRVPVENVVHFRLGVDPMDIRKGLGPVKFLGREIATDGLATHFSNTLLRNYAVPGLVVIPKEGYLDEDEAREAKARLHQAFSGDNLGMIAVLSSGADVKQFGHDPEKIALNLIHRHVEERIAAVMNVPAMVAQLGAGLQQASQFTNFHEAREMFAENTCIPIFEADQETMTVELLWEDFTNNRDLRLLFDRDKVRALQVDITERINRLQTAVRGGWMTANEARAQIFLPPITDKTDVPRSQGEDNRFNTLVEIGGVTINEARESIGLDPLPGEEGERPANKPLGVEEPALLMAPEQGPGNRLLPDTQQAPGAQGQVRGGVTPSPLPALPKLPAEKKDLLSLHLLLTTQLEPDEIMELKALYPGRTLAEIIRDELL